MTDLQADDSTSRIKRASVRGYLQSSAMRMEAQLASVLAILCVGVLFIRLSRKHHLASYACILLLLVKTTYESVQLIVRCFWISEGESEAAQHEHEVLADDSNDSYWLTMSTPKTGSKLCTHHCWRCHPDSCRHHGLVRDRAQKAYREEHALPRQFQRAWRDKEWSG